jgi:rare lipoprotein A
MPLRQTIAVSLALLMASAGAMAETPDKGTSPPLSQPPDPGQPQSAGSAQTARASQQVGYSQPVPRAASRAQSQPRYRQPAQPNAAASYRRLRWVLGAPQIGRAAWYDLVGRRTADGERLDTVTPTAAHRSLPLGSWANVVDLDTGRSVIVKINDRGPYHRRFIIDLSPSAAAALGMRYAGVAAVAVEPITLEAAEAASAAPAYPATRSTVTAAYQVAATNITQ